jgi:DNA-binding MarR family transcriptional regulator
VIGIGGRSAHAAQLRLNAGATSLNKKADIVLPAGVTRSAAELNNALLFRISQATNLMHKTGTNWGEEMGLTTQQWTVLGALSAAREQDGIPVGEFSELLLLTRQNLNSVLGRMEKQGLTVRVASDPDARVKKVRLTPKGRRIWEVLDKEIKAYCGVVLKGFTTDEKVTFLRLIDQLRENLIGLDKAQTRSLDQQDE